MTSNRPFKFSRITWPEIEVKRDVSPEDFKSMVEGNWGSIEDRIHSYYAEQQVRKEELEFMRGQDTRLTDLFNLHGSMVHCAEKQIIKQHPLFAALEEYCMKDVLHTEAMRQGDDNEEDPGVLSDLEELTRDDGGVYPDGLDDPMSAIRSFCR